MFTLIVASLALILLVYALSVFVDGFFAFFDFGLLSPEPPADRIVSAARGGMSCLTVMLFGLPLWYGMRVVSMRMTAEESSPTAAMLFSAFDSFAVLRRVWGASLWMLWRAALSGGLIGGMWYGVTLLLPRLVRTGDVLITAAAVLLTPVLLLPLAGTHLVFPMLSARPDLTVRAAIFRSTRAVLGALPETLCFWGSFIPWFALAFVSGGVLLVLFVLPYFLLADALFARYLIARAAQSATLISYHDTEETTYVQ